jgi:hypothetical protein
MDFDFYLLSSFCQIMDELILGKKKDPELGKVAGLLADCGLLFPSS